MSTQLLDIQPREVKLIFEVKKQSSCAIQLANISQHYVAFKVKTTSPKKYCVRPNTGIIKPNSKCDFTVVMVAQRSVPSDLRCKDKFLIQSTIVPFGATEDDVSFSLFSKDSGKHIEEKKLKVMLISPPHSPPVLLPSNGVTKQELSRETSLRNEKPLTSGIENFPPPTFVKVADDIIKVKVTMPSPIKDEKLGNDIQELMSKLTATESQLSEANCTIRKLTEEISTHTRETETLTQELAVIRKTKCARKVYIGFPFLYVCMVALISLTVGYILHG